MEWTWCENIKKMYEAGDGHVLVLAASIRHLQHLLGYVASKAGAEQDLGRVGGMIISTPRAGFVYHRTDEAGRPLKLIAYKSLDLNRAWESSDIRHDLTTKGIQQFVADYKLR